MHTILCDLCQSSFPNLGKGSISARVTGGYLELMLFGNAYTGQTRLIVIALRQYHSRNLKPGNHESLLEERPTPGHLVLRIALSLLAS